MNGIQRRYGVPGVWVVGVELVRSSAAQAVHGCTHKAALVNSVQIRRERSQDRAVGVEDSVLASGGGSRGAIWMHPCVPECPRFLKKFRHAAASSTPRR